LQFGKTWFISLSLFLLAFSRCSDYNRHLERAKKILGFDIPNQLR
jgi:hypothetical protein